MFVYGYKYLAIFTKIKQIRKIYYAQLITNK